MSDDEDEASLAISGIPVGLLDAIGEGGANLSAVGLNTWDFERPYEPGSIGYDQGEDFEDEVNKEIKLEEDDLDYFVSQTTGSRAHDPTSTAPRSKRAREIDGSRPRKRARAAATEPSKPRELSDVWPTFEKGKILNLTQLLKGQVHRKSRAQFPLSTGDAPPLPAPSVPSVRNRPLPATINLKAASRDVSNQLLSEATHELDPKKEYSGNVTLRKALMARSAENTVVEDPGFLLNERNYDLVNLSDWESSIVYAPSMTTIRGPSLALHQPMNAALDSGIWTQSIIWDLDTPFLDFTQLQLEETDTHSAEFGGASATDSAKKDKEDAPSGKRKKKRAEATQPHSVVLPNPLHVHRTTDLFKDKYNISNDYAYEISRERHRVRQTFGQLVVQHAYPALKLQLPFYKTRLSKSEARSFHRPALQFPSNIELKFSKVRSAKKKKDKSGRKVSAAGGGDPSEALRKTSDLTLRETGPFVLWEYSEEHPPTMSNLGMGSILVNYYRKRDASDEHVPNLDLGEPFILEPGDESPFMKFGSVAPGQTIPALYNNLVRAPLFRHKAPTTDFLVVKSTISGQTRYYLREIKALFALGQTYPVTEVPGPHSRKITGTIKYRLQFIAYKLLRKSPEERLRLPSVMKYFPDQNELQMRQRLKEFMEYHRTGPHQGYWRLKTNHEMLPDAKMFELITPEHVVLSESMQVGQRHLLDAGYGKAGAEADEAGDDSKLDIEQQLAPWITTKNFIHATQAKAMLKLHGPGDPTGRGEAFSFIRVSMKDIFVRAGEDPEEKQAEADQQRPKTGHRYNVAQQQVVYRSEIDRIWKAQYDSLINKIPPELSDEEDLRGHGADRIKGEGSGERESSPLFQESPRGSPAFGRPNSPGRDDDGPSMSNKVLRIRRLVDGEWRMEIVRDPNVISAYMKRREEIEFDKIPLDQMVPTGIPEKDAVLYQKLLDKRAKMQKNQERRLQRKNAAIIKEGGAPIVLDRAPKPDTSRRCGHCGQIGHMKTNRKCPRWAEFNKPGGASSPPATSPPPSSPADDRRYGPGLGSPGGGLMPPPPVPPSAFRPNTFSYPAVPSPLATSPPVSAFDHGVGSNSGAARRASSLATSPVASSSTPSGSKPKIKLSLKPPIGSSPN